MRRNRLTCKDDRQTLMSAVEVSGDLGMRLPHSNRQRVLITPWPILVLTHITAFCFIPRTLLRGGNSTREETEAEREELAQGGTARKA